MQEAKAALEAHSVAEEHRMLSVKRFLSLSLRALRALHLCRDVFFSFFSPCANKSLFFGARSCSEPVSCWHAGTQQRLKEPLNRTTRLVRLCSESRNDLANVVQRLGGNGPLWKISIIFFHVLKTMCWFILLVLKGNYHYWKCLFVCFFSPRRRTCKWKYSGPTDDRSGVE